MNGVVMARPKPGFVLLWALAALVVIAESIIYFMPYKLMVQWGIEINAFSTISLLVLVAIHITNCISMFFTRVIISESTLIYRYGLFTYRIPCNNIFSINMILRGANHEVPTQITVEYSRHNRKNRRVILEYAAFHSMDLKRIVDLLVQLNPQLESDRQRISNKLADY